MKRTIAILLAALCVGAQTQTPLPQPPQPKLEAVPRAQQPLNKPPTQAKPTDKDKDQDQPFRVITNVFEVALPVTFLDGAGDFVTDVEKAEVTLFDNKMAQKIQTFEIAYRPISIVVLVDTSTRMDGVLPNLKSSGILLTQLVMGETGEASVLTYDQTVELKQPFTKDGDAIERIFKNLKTEGGQSKLTDAVFRGLGMLSNRPTERRKVILILGEGRDLGSELKKNQALREAQLSNVSIYTVELSAFKALAKRDLPVRTVDPLPPGARGTMSGGNIPAPRGVDSMDLGTPTLEALRAAKAFIWAHPLRTYAGGTGSDHINATSTKSLEEAVQRIGRELHSQYWLSYSPNNLHGEELHTIDVKINRPYVKVRARPSYFYVPSTGEVVDPDKIPK